MQDLHHVGFTKDHRGLIFSTRKDAKSGGYVVPVDDDLLAAVQRALADRPKAEVDRSESEPAEPKVESRLSVREVQARLRAGEPVSVVASDAGVDPDWVERFSAPIRAEQRRIVDRALTVPLSRARSGVSAVPLRRAVAAAMAERDIDFSSVGFENAWSARLVGGDSWIVSFEFPNRGRTRRLDWDFDLADGLLTTTDRFASQLAFVEAVRDLPPADATVGAEPTRVASPLVRGALTSGGLARPGSGRVTTPSTTADGMPPVVRPSSAPPPPRPPQSVRAPEPAPSPPVEPRTDRDMRREVEDRAWPRDTPPIRVRRPDTERHATPAVRRLPPLAGEQPPAPSPQRLERKPAPATERPEQPRPVASRRPAPAAARTNASNAYARRPAPEVAERIPVTEADHGVARGGRSHAPGRGESVVILRSVEDGHDGEVDDPTGPDEVYEPTAVHKIAIAGDAAYEADQDLLELTDELDDEDDVELDDPDLGDPDAYLDDLEDDPSFDDPALDDVDLDDPDLDDPDLDDSGIDDSDLQDSDLADSDLAASDVDDPGLDDPGLDDPGLDDTGLDDPGSDYTGFDDPDVEETAGDNEFSITLTIPEDTGSDLDDERDDDAAQEPEADEGTTALPVVQRKPRRRLRARPVQAAPVEGHEDDAVVEPVAPPRRSTVQIRPGSATQAGASSNGSATPASRDAAPADASQPTPRRRRRRSEPLRAR